MRTAIANLRYGLRMLLKNRGLTAAVIATLALGIGATTAIYTVVYAVLIAPLPYPHPEQLVMVWSKDRRRPEFNVGRRLSRLEGTEQNISANGGLHGRQF